MNSFEGSKSNRCKFGFELHLYQVYERLRILRLTTWSRPLQFLIGKRLWPRIILIIMMHRFQVFVSFTSGRRNRTVRDKSEAYKKQSANLFCGDSRIIFHSPMLHWKKISLLILDRRSCVRHVNFKKCNICCSIRA